MTEIEAREIVARGYALTGIHDRILVGNSSREAIFAKGFLAGIFHERAMAERLVEAAKKARSVLLDHANRHDSLMKATEAYAAVEEAISAYNQERGEKKGKA